MTIKPHLACDIDLDKARFPLVGMPKIDGVRALNLDGRVTGRSLKEFKNKFVSHSFGHPHFLGVDGELVLGDWTSPRLCSETTGFVNRKTAKPGKPTEANDFFWYVFDYLAPDAIDLPYIERLALLEVRHGLWLVRGETCAVQIRKVPWKMIESKEEALDFDAKNLDAGFEGSIFRDPYGLHKSGRATVNTNAYLRLKRFIDFEGIIVEVIEAMENTNEAKINELGRTERSTHKENMVPKGMVGMIRKQALADVLCPQTGRVLIEKDQVVSVGPGNMDHKERVRLFENKHEIIGQIGKSKFFPKGQKDLPRFPTFIGLRAEEDMS